MKLLAAYVHQHRRAAVLLVLFCSVFVLTFALYQLPVQAVLYPAALCAAVGAGAILWDMRRLSRLHRQLTGIETIEQLEQGLPEPDSVEAADYQAVLLRLREKELLRRTEASRRYEDMVDYYTVWAHQIKTPIAAMDLRLQKEDSRLSRQLQGELFRISQYVEMVLVFLRLDSASTDYLIREYQLDTLICQAVKKFSGEFIGRRLRLSYEPVPDRVLTDEKWLSFVLEQVLSNALKYTASGSITITMERPDVLCIRDTGMGIAPEDLPRIFEKGYTGNHGRSDKKASGIGLYLCRRICTNLGHKIWAESTPDVGTAIFLDLSRTALEVE